MKSVQGDSGHAQVKMAADVYSHIIDDDRRINAQRFEEQFYQPKGRTFKSSRGRHKKCRKSCRIKAFGFIYFPREFELVANCD